MSVFGSFSLQELTCMHCVYLALSTRKVLCGSILCAIYKFSFIHSFIHNFRCIDVDSINLTKLRSLRFETNLCSFRLLFMISRRNLFRLNQLLDVRSKIRELSLRERAVVLVQVSLRNH